MKKHNATYVAHRECPYFPCHKNADPDNFNCLFCYCPLYALGADCGGTFYYTADGIKDCSECLLPHKKEGFDHVMRGCGQVLERTRRKES